MAKEAKSRALQRGDYAKSIFDLLEARIRPDRARDYIGASVIATPCDRALFYVKERVQPAPAEARAYRIFEFGDAIERLTIQWLRDVGLHVYDIDPATNDQFKVRSHDDALQGHLDGIVSRQSLFPDLFNPDPIAYGFVPVFYFLEIKSHKNDRWNEVVDTGVQHAKFEHYAQLQTYLKHSKAIARRSFCLDAAAAGGLYIAVNKDTSELYLEEVEYNNDVANVSEQRASKIQSQSAPPPRLAQRADLLPCKYCDFKAHCFGDTRAIAIPQRISDADRPDARAPATFSDDPSLCDSERRVSNVASRKTSAPRRNTARRA